MNKNAKLSLKTLGNGAAHKADEGNTDQPLSMSAGQATSLAADLYNFGEDQLAGEIDDAVRSATRYSSM